MAKAVGVEIGLHGEAMDSLFVVAPWDNKPGPEYEPCVRVDNLGGRWPLPAIGIDLQLEGEGCWPELNESGFIEGQIEGIARLPNSTEAGASAVTFKVVLPDGRIVLAQLTTKLLSMAMAAINTRDVMDIEKQMC